MLRRVLLCLLIPLLRVVSHNLAQPFSKREHCFQNIEKRKVREYKIGCSITRYLMNDKLESSHRLAILTNNRTQLKTFRLSILGPFARRQLWQRCKRLQPVYNRHLNRYFPALAEAMLHVNRFSLALSSKMVRSVEVRGLWWNPIHCCDLGH